jgi:hypothetical protein
MDIHSKDFKAMIKEIARRNETDPDIVRNVIIAQFECVRVNMRRADSYNNFFPYIKLPYLFTVKVLPRKRKYYVEKSKKILEDVYSQEREAGDRAEDAIHPGVQTDP